MSVISNEIDITLDNDLHLTIFIDKRVACKGTVSKI